MPASCFGGKRRPYGSAAGKCEIAIASLGPSTVRITVNPLGRTGSVPDDGALAPAASNAFAARSGTDGLQVRLIENPPALHIETAAGKLVQRLTLDSASHDVSFLLPKGPLLGMGQGGPQFDCKGSVDSMRNGQGGYRLRTHGGRVPIQWLVGTDGWGLYIHQPLGTFDFTGKEGRFSIEPVPPGSPDETPPLDVFVVASEDPTEILAEYARLTGYAELPPRWTFGYQQSHRTLSGPEEIRRVARTFREKKLLATRSSISGRNSRRPDGTRETASSRFTRRTFPNR